MMYRVVKSFSDLLDNNYKYGVGDVYPRAGLVVSKDRIKELSTTNNKRGAVMIAEIPEEASPLAKEEPSGVKANENTAETQKPKEKAKKK